MPRDEVFLGLFRRRSCTVPTWRGWLLFLLILAVVTIAAVRGVHPFLAVEDSKPGGVLVIEGWGPDYAMEIAIEEFHRNHYEKLFVTGGPLESGAPLSEFKSYAELGTATLLKMGLRTNEVQAAPAPFARQDRTYTSAVYLRKWIQDHGLQPRRLNLMTLGPHARRSRLLFEKAFGKNTVVGVLAINPRDYDQQRWWRSSQGFRTVMSEAIAYGYVRVFFRAPEA